MALPDSYTLKPGAIPDYLESMLNAEAPERFTTRFMEGLDFKSTNDRLFINVLKDLGFIDTDGVPKDRYFEFLDRTQSARIVAEGIREAFSDLFAVNKNAHLLAPEDVKNKLRTLYKGAKKDNVISRIASTFAALCEYADFDAQPSLGKQSAAEPKSSDRNGGRSEMEAAGNDEQPRRENRALELGALQYHINIVLPDSRDQAVYDAIFKSLRDHLGGK